MKAEKGEQTVKRLLKKAAHSNSNPYPALMSYRAALLESGKQKQKTCHDHTATALVPLQEKDVVWREESSLCTPFSKSTFGLLISELQQL